MSNNRRNKREVTKPVATPAAEARTRGKDMARLEAEIHSMKQEVEAYRRRLAPSVHGTDKAYALAASHIPRLLTSTEEQEAAWLLAIADPSKVAARIPTSEVTGAVPVDLWRKTVQKTFKADTSGNAFVLSAPDAQSQDGTGAVYGLLHESGVDATCATVSDGSTVLAGTFPAFGALPLGAVAVGIGDISNEFTSDSATGTEYIMVGCVTKLRTAAVASAAADAAFNGRVKAFYTADPERYPLLGQSPDDLEALSEEQGALVTMREYLITRDGEFVPYDDESTDPIQELSTVSLPVTTDAYKWRRCGAVSLAPMTGVVTCPNVAYWINGPASTWYEIELTYLWQTERYASNKVVDNSDDSPHPLLAPAGFTIDNSHGYEGYTDPQGVFHGGALPFNLQGQPGYKGMQLLALPPAEPTPTGPCRRRLQGRVETHAPNGGVPGAGLVFARAVMPHPGKPIHPAIAPLAVLDHQMKQPGMAHLIKTNPPSAVGNVAPKAVAKLAVMGNGSSASASRPAAP